MRLWSYCDQLNVRRQLYVTALLRVDLCHDDTYDDDDDDFDDDDDDIYIMMSVCNEKSSLPPWSLL